MPYKQKGSCRRCYKVLGHPFSKLCRSCYVLLNRGDKHPSYRGGLPRCLKCNSILSSRYTKTGLCRLCHDKINGSAHWNWKGGTPKRSLNTKKYKDWRDAVYKRDNYTCQKCFKSGCYLNAHHIIFWSESKDLRFDINNGITLCVKCHNTTHDLIGWKPRSNKEINELLSVYPSLWGV